jgi:hypothetical protein
MCPICRYFTRILFKDDYSRQSYQFGKVDAFSWRRNASVIGGVLYGQCILDRKLARPPAPVAQKGRP